MDHRETLDVQLAESTRQHIYKVIADLPLCGCGSPEPAYELVVELLKLVPFYERQPDEIRTLTGQSDGVHYLVLGSLDHADLIEHGTSIDGSWITPKGEWFLKAVEAAGGAGKLFEATHNIGYPHNGANCTDQCWKARTT